MNKKIDKMKMKSMKFIYYFKRKRNKKSRKKKQFVDLRLSLAVLSQQPKKIHANIHKHTKSCRHKHTKRTSANRKRALHRATTSQKRSKKKNKREMQWETKQRLANAERRFTRIEKDANNNKQQKKH